jgi:hypothetical protein
MFKYFFIQPVVKRGPYLSCKGLFGIAVAIAVQSVFRLEMHQNDIYLFLKNYFLDQNIKTI